MTKPKGRPKRSERDDVTIKVDRKIAARAKIVASHRGITLAELASEIMQGPIDKAYVAVVRELEGKG